MRTRTLVAVLAATALVTGGVVGGALTAGAGAATSTSVVLRAPFPAGGGVKLQVESGNLHPVLCFWYASALPTDGMSIRADLRRAGTLELVQELGTGHQWVDGSASGCEVPDTDTALAGLLASPKDYVATFEVVETQGGPPLPGVFASRPLAVA